MDPIFWPYVLALWANTNANNTFTTEVIHRSTTADYIVIGVMILVATTIVSWICHPSK